MLLFAGTGNLQQFYINIHPRRRICTYHRVNIKTESEAKRSGRHIERERERERKRERKKVIVRGSGMESDTVRKKKMRLRKRDREWNRGEEAELRI